MGSGSHINSLTSSKLLLEMCSPQQPSGPRQTRSSSQEDALEANTADALWSVTVSGASLHGSYVLFKGSGKYIPAAIMQSCLKNPCGTCPEEQESFCNPKNRATSICFVIFVSLAQHHHQHLLGTVLCPLHCAKCFTESSHSIPIARRGFLLSFIDEETDMGS